MLRNNGLSLGLGAFLWFSAGCQGAVSGPGAESENPPPNLPPPEVVTTPSDWITPESGMRRLSQWEYANSVRDLLGMAPARAFEILPSDGRLPFDNDATAQAPSSTLISGAELLATAIAQEALSSEAGRREIVPCTPSAADDVVCFRQFVQAFTLRAFRRPLKPEEVDEFVPLSSFGVESDDFYVGAETLIAAVLQDPRFLYRLEMGQPTEEDNQLHRLESFEVATRLSFLILGTTPSDWLLEQASSKDLTDPAEIADVARQLLSDPGALDQAVRYHELWLDYELIGASNDLSARFRTESGALIRRVIDEHLPWSAILSLKETYVDSTLAEHYGIPSPSGAGFDWVSLAGTDRGGILSHGAFLVDEADSPETNPTRRGAEIRARLFCQVLEVPANVVAEPPAGEPAVDENACTPARLAAHASGGCAGCHSLTDPIGFGLEQYDMTGQYRDHESGKPECAIDGQGAISGVGEFSGSGELGSMLATLPEVRGCFVQQLTRFSTGRPELTNADRELATAIAEQLGGEMTYHDAILALVTHQGFIERRLESERREGE